MDPLNTAQGTPLHPRPPSTTRELLNIHENEEPSTQLVTIASTVVRPPPQGIQHFPRPVVSISSLPHHYSQTPLSADASTLPVGREEKNRPYHPSIAPMSTFLGGLSYSSIDPCLSTPTGHSSHAHTQPYPIRIATSSYIPLDTCNSRGDQNSEAILSMANSTPRASSQLRCSANISSQLAECLITPRKRNSIPRRVVCAMIAALSNPRLSYDERGMLPAITGMRLYMYTKDIEHLSNVFLNVLRPALVDYLWVVIWAAYEQVGECDLGENTQEVEAAEEKEHDFNGFIERIEKLLPKTNFLSFGTALREMSRGPNYKNATEKVLHMIGKHEVLVTELKNYLDDIRQLLLGCVIQSRPSLCHY